MSMHTVTRPAVVLAAASLLLALAACSTPAPAAVTKTTAADPDTADYLILARVAWGIPAGDTSLDSKMLGTGRSICDGLTRGISGDEENGILLQSGLTQGQATLLMQATVKVLCPEQLDKLPS